MCYMRNMLGVVYMAETNVVLLFYKQNILGLDCMDSWNMFIYMRCMLIAGGCLHE